MNAIKTINSFISVRSVSILIILLCVGILLSCSSGDVGSPDFTISTGGFEISDPEFTADKTILDEIQVENHNRIIVEAINGEVVVMGQTVIANVITKFKETNFDGIAEETQYRDRGKSLENIPSPDSFRAFRCGGIPLVFIILLAHFLIS